MNDPKILAKDRWESIGEIEIRHRLSVADTSYFYDEPLIIPVDTGKYLVSVRYISPEGHKHIAAVRVVAGETQFSRADKLGEVLVDFAQIGICDRDAVESAFNSLGDVGLPQYYEQLNTTALVSWVRLPVSVEMLVIRPGYGDGTFPAYDLLRCDGKRGGVEIRFSAWD